MWSCLVQQQRPPGPWPWFEYILTKPSPFLARIGALGPPRRSWKTARTEIASSHESEKQIFLNAGLYPFVSRISWLWLISSSRGLVRPDCRVNLDRRWIWPKKYLHASMRCNFSISMEKVWHKVHIFITTGYSKRVLSFSNRTNCLFCIKMIGSISDWTSCFPQFSEATNLN